MILLSTVFPVAREFSREQLVDLAAMHLELPGPVLDIAGSGWQALDETVIGGGGGPRLTLSNYEEAMLFELEEPHEGGAYITRVVLRDRDGDPSMSVIVEKQVTSMSLGEIGQLESVPRILEAVFWDEAGGDDGGFPVEDRPYMLRKAGLPDVLSRIGAEGGHVLPIVYLSVGRDGMSRFDAQAMARELAGQAHVIAEASPVVSSLALAGAMKCGLRLPADGEAGIFLPEQKACIPADVDQDRAVQMVRAMVSGLSVTAKYNMDDIRRGHMLSRFEDADMARLCEEMLAERDRAVEQAQAEANALRAELERYRQKADGLEAALKKSDSDNAAGVSFSVTEHELYPGEFEDVILRVLAAARASMESDVTLSRCRKYHILDDILSHNMSSGNADVLMDVLKNAFSDGVLTRDGISRLKSVGFDVKKDGSGHHKLTFGGDTRYMGTFGSTPSDKARASKNLISELGNLLFGY